MIKRSILLYIIGCCFAVHLNAQQEPKLLQIGSEQITRSEFESVYAKYTLSTPNNPKEIREFLPQFIDDRLKIVEARTLGLDTTPEFRSKVETYGETLRMRFLNESVRNILSNEESLTKVPSAKRFQVLQIFKYIPQNCSSPELNKIDQTIRRLHSELTNDPQLEFEDYVQKHSDDKRRFEFGPNEMSVEFEHAVFAMQKGDISTPFFTPQGVHVVKVLDIKDDLSDHEYQRMLLNRAKKKYKNRADDALLQRLKETYSYVPEQNNIKELLTTGDTKKVLFTLDGEAYTGEDFRYFAEANPKGIKRQFEDFVTKSLVDCENKHWESAHSEYHLSVKEYEDALLLSEIVRLQVGDKAESDQEGLSAYFSTHKKKYRWSPPRFKGVVLHTLDKGVIPEAKKILKKRPFDEWEGFVNEYFNLAGVQQVQVEQGIFAVGENVFVDALVFKKGNAISPTSYPFTAVIGKKIKGPENYKDIGPILISDYQEFLETRWMKRLHETYRVEISEEVLKTVNNH